MMPNAAVVWSVTARAVVGVNAALSRRQREHGESIAVVIVGRGTAREAPRELEKTDNLIGDLSNRLSRQSQSSTVPRQHSNGQKSKWLGGAAPAM